MNRDFDNLMNARMRSAGRAVAIFGVVSAIGGLAVTAGVLYLLYAAATFLMSHA